YDYSGFPQSAYDIQYPAPGNPDLAKKIFYLLQDNGIEAKLDETRGFDHGLFVPLKIMFPEANIPCVQISLINSLDAKSHVLIGKALSELRKEKVLIIGSGFTFHNMKSFFSQKEGESDEKNEAFEKWLVDVCTNDVISESDRANKLIAWKEAPYSEYCQPREEHLLPLHVCYGLSGTVAKLVFDGKVIGKRTSSFLW
ncbi:MAG: dioxygenase, partial [Gammaproteobacteria bacterium]|nr:dioxygenase [Gammaproteobacteria bacterium]